MSDYRALFARFARLASTAPNDASEVAYHCPFHGDERPSASLNVATGLWYCFACQEGGTARRFLEKLGVPCEEAEALLREAASVAPEEAVSAWHRRLRESAAPLAYLESRRLLCWEVLERLAIGWDTERIVIPVYDRDGVLVALRRLAVDGRKPKVLNLGGTEAQLWPVRVLDAAREAKEPVWVCEGETDCLSALCQGLYAVTGTGGAGVWKEEWPELFSGLEVFVAYDGDEAGRRGAEKVAASLARHAAAVWMVEVPDGKDLNALHIEGASIADLPRERYLPPDAEALVEALPEHLQGQELEAWLERFLESLRGASAVRREKLLKAAARKVGVRVEVLRKRLEYMEQKKAEPATPKPLPRPWQPDLSLAQDYRDGILHYGIWLPTGGDPAWVFRLVGSDRQLVEADEDVPKPAPLHRWSVDSATPYNVFAWLGKATPPVDGAELFRELRDVFADFMWYPDDWAYDVLALWVMMGYVYMVFDTVPYLALTGTKEAGKTRTLELLQELAFNATKASSVSTASLYRTVDMHRAVMLFDEGDILAAAQQAKEGVDDRLAVVLDGYKRHAKALRYDPDAGVMRQFSSYSPKAYASMYGLPDTVVSRSVVIRTLRRPPEMRLKSLVLAREARRFQVLRNRLYCWGLENAARVAEARDALREEAVGVADREYEIWHPLYCVAVAAHGGEALPVAEWAQANREAKQAEEEEVAWSHVLVRVCWDLLHEQPDEEDAFQRKWYSRARIRAKLAHHLDVDSDRITPHRIRHELVRAGIIDPRGRYGKQFRHGDLRGVRAYRLEETRVRAAAERYGVELEED